MKINPVKMKIKSCRNDLANRIAELLQNARNSIIRNINTTMVVSYFEVGRMIVENEQQGKHRAEYGEKILKEISIKLTKRFGKGFSVDSLENMRKFYLIYSQEIAKTVKIEKSKTLFRKLFSESVSEQKSETTSRIFKYFKLSYSHYLMLMRMIDEDERKFYEIESIKNNWSLRELKRQYNSALYTRLTLSKDKKKILELSTKGQIIETPSDLIKDPYILEFTGLSEKSNYSESNLEQQLIDKIWEFLLELGKGFMFVGRQVRFTFSEKHFRIDSVFYNRILKCFVLIDLKIGELNHQDIGQMQMYVNYYDRQVKSKDENNTIGIVLCQEKDEAVVEYTLPKNNEQIFASKYLTILPKKEELKKLLENR